MGKVLDLDASREGLFQEPKCHKERKKEGTEVGILSGVRGECTFKA